MKRMVVALVLLAACRTDERMTQIEAHLTDIQRRVGALEIRGDELRPTWWCSSARCMRMQHDGAQERVFAWCRWGDATTCRETLEQCGEGCVGVR